MKAILLVALGGSLGAISRWLLAGWIDRASGVGKTVAFPWGIFAANVIGCLIIGILYGVAEARGMFSEMTRLLVFTGFLGSFTTFSTFGWNTFELFKSGQPGTAFANVLASVIAGLLAVWIGYSAAARLSFGTES
ncbi:MAG: fluoride efflux transporter CrcB [Verrucomicrobiales bacterium]|nr:fluoride efflux transporter CrcB [Verrucomicrobiales bacterium]